MSCDQRGVNTLTSRTRRTLGAALLLAALGVAVSLWWLLSRKPPVVVGDDALPAICRKLTFEDVGYVVCEVEPTAYDIRLFHAASDGKPYGSLDSFDQAMATQGRPALLAMNAGMYHDDLSPVGLYVEGGHTLSPVQTGEGEGNFFLKPNGVFLIGKDGEPAIMETGAYYAAANPTPDYATQSGPLLVLGGTLHPKFEGNGKSRYTRNGVGVRPDKAVVLAISLSEVSFGSFARALSRHTRLPGRTLFRRRGLGALKR